MKRLCFLFGRLLSFIIPRDVIQLLKSLYRYVYTGYYSRQFKYFGKGSSFEPKCMVTGLKNISVGDECHFQKGLRLSALSDYKGQHFDSEIIIGNNAAFGPNNHITCANQIIIGDNLLTGGGVLITDNSHGDSTLESLKVGPNRRKVTTKGPIKIGDNVWLGDNVCVLPGVTIGDGAVVGSNSVVTKNIPAYSIAVGCPAKVIKTVNN